MQVYRCWNVDNDAAPLDIEGLDIEFAAQQEDDADIERLRTLAGPREAPPETE